MNFRNRLYNTHDDNEVSFAQEATSEPDSLSNEEDLNNDLSEFGVDTDSPDLFNSDNESESSTDLLSSENDEKDDDLEIPAFLRRQKN